MATSLTDIARFMDAADDEVSLRHLAEHHRWLAPPAPVSFEAMAARHRHPQSVRLRLLCYNTFLMRVRVALAKGLADASTPREVMEALGIHPRQLLDEYDVCDLLPSGPAFFPGPREACKVAGSAANFVIGFFGGADAAADAVIKAIGAEKAIEIILRLAGVPGEVTLKSKPALAPRAREIGGVLRDEAYDVAALCEVWNADLRGTLLTEWHLPASKDHLAMGEPEGEAFMGDGLLFGSRDGRILEVVRHGYKTRGIDRSPTALLDLVTDDELWAQKGVLLVRLDAGVGVIDFYLTHLYFGEGITADTDIGKFFPTVAPPTNAERAAVRSAQISELRDFMAATHRPEHIAVVCGDFNVDANGQAAAYGGLQALQNFMADRHLEDRWSVPHAALTGSTDGNFGAICPASWPTDARFCLDATSSDGGRRIDLLLVEQPTPEHTFTLDVTRIGRRSFPRPVPTEDQAHMSDHLGLDCTLLASPKMD